MTSESTTAGSEPTREQVDQMQGAVVLEFGAGWCGYCQELQPAVDELRAKHPDARYIWVEDGRGKRLGRSFRVKLWPTLVFMRDGQVLKQVSRPSREEVEEGFRQLSPAE
jgi:thioredoxin 1